MRTGEELLKAIADVLRETDEEQGWDTDEGMYYEYGQALMSAGLVKL